MTSNSGSANQAGKRPGAYALLIAGSGADSSAARNLASAARAEGSNRSRARAVRLGGPTRRPRSSRVSARVAPRSHRGRAGQTGCAVEGSRVHGEAQPASCDLLPDEWGTAVLRSAECDQSVARQNHGMWQRNVTRRVPAVSGETEQKVDISSTRRTALTSASLTWGTP
jgi:hypothetical protein